MDTAKRFFRKYLFSSMAILITFIIINIMLIFGIFILSMRGVENSDVPVSDIAACISIDSEGNVSARSNISELLSKTDSWAMVLNDEGNVIWDYDLPGDLPRHYTSVDIAKFTRWYLDDYPVLVQVLPSGLLVIGYPPDSYSKHNIVINNYMGNVIVWGSIIVVAINILMVILLFFHNTRKVEKATVPILQGIEEIAHGNSVSLPEKGELAGINSKLNKAGQYINNRDKARAEWINGVSHDVRTPLSIMLGYAGEMEDNPELNEALRAQAGIIRKQGEKLRRLIADLNLTSKLEYSMEPLKVKTVYPVELARQVITEFLNNGLEDKYPIDFDFQDEETDALEGDESLLTRMLTNLIQNSISHNPEAVSYTHLDVYKRQVITFAINTCSLVTPEQRIQSSTLCSLSPDTKSK